MSRMKSRSCSTMTSEQCCLIGWSNSPVTRRSSRLMPPVGSSSSRSFGLPASAIAISSHCCWPCDSAAAGIEGAIGEAELRQHGHDLIMQRAARAREHEVEQRGLRLQREQDVVVERQRRQHAGDLEFQAHAGPGPLGRRERGDVGVDEAHLALRRHFGTRNALHQRALAGAVGADQAVKLVLADGERGAVQRGELAEDLDDAARLQGAPLRFSLRLPGSAEAADPLAFTEHETDQAERPEQDHEQQQHAENDRPDVAIIVRQPEADALDDDGADDGADQRAGAAEQHVEHHLRRDRRRRPCWARRSLRGRHKGCRRALRWRRRSRR